MRCWGKSPSGRNISTSSLISQVPLFRYYILCRWIHQCSTAVLRETLRITPSVTAFTVEAFEDTVVKSGDKEYTIPVDAGITVLAAQLHMDTKVWGEDVRLSIFVGVTDTDYTHARCSDRRMFFVLSEC
jgi:Cytochrome P450